MLLFRHPPLMLLLSLTSLTLILHSASEELQILLDFKSALRSSQSNVFTSWTKENPKCNFTGILCNSDGLVTEINLSQRNLSGNIHFDTICALGSLEKIDLGMNSLSGTISEDVRNCTRLKYFNVGWNSFSGKVPSLSNLRDLEFLDLNNSGFSGIFPWKSLENLTNLAFLSLGDNPFDESPFPEEVSRLDKLYWLYLTNSSLRGSIPDGIGNLTRLQNLELSDNLLSGPIPEGIGRLRDLRQLELYNNSLTGRLPFGLRNLTKLLSFDCSQNKLGGDLSETRFLTQLASLQLFQNQFSGEIPEEIGEFRNLVELSLYMNSLTGPLPQKLGSWADFNYIDVSENFLTGTIPPDMCRNGKMTDLLMLKNRFTGAFPSSYANCSSLVRLRVSNNLLSGEIPAGVWGLPNLIIFDVAANQHQGPISSDIWKAKSLAQLFLAENKLSGELPEGISEATSLVSIQLSFNEISGEVPSTIGNLKRLGSLYLNGNLLSGSLPSSIGDCVSLTDLNLSNNSLSGEIPSAIGSLPMLNSLNLSGNKFSGRIPETLSTLKLSLLDLSNNQLTGSIPDSLTIQAYNESFNGNSGLCSQKFKQLQPCQSSTRASGHLVAILSSFIMGAVCLLLACGCYLFVKFKPSCFEKPPCKPKVSWSMKPYHVLNFSEWEIVDAIKTENLIGKGGSGNVYKVVLRSGEELAIKHVFTTLDNRESFRSTSSMLLKQHTRSREYESEVSALSSIRHMNVVKLYCSITSDDSNFLVYEYLPNGSLWDRLHESQKTEMDWGVRYEIAVGAARGLEYLHHGCQRPIVHRDVKSSNILLDAEWKPRIADFGLAKIVQPGDGGNWTRTIAGTHGYIAPGT